MSSSKCKQCGESLQTGNYLFRVLPAKRVPKKALKLLKSGKNLEKDCTNLGGLTKFQKFLAKRAKPMNAMEITCGKCGGIMTLKMNKGLTKSPETSSASMSVTNRKSQPRKDNDPRHLGNPSGSSSQRKHGQGQPNASGNPSSSQSKKRQKELENLNKMLFKSKKAKKSGSTLQDFLSSI